MTGEIDTGGVLALIGIIVLIIAAIPLVVWFVKDAFEDTVGMAYPRPNPMYPDGDHTNSRFYETAPRRIEQPSSMADLASRASQSRASQPSYPQAH